MGRNSKILIVEDDSESIELLKYFLKPEGYSIDVASDGKTAVKKIESATPDLVILDVMLPELNGFQVCETIKHNEKLGHIPVIMLTALKELKDKIKALEVGADDFISKPFDSLELLARVRSLLRSSEYYKELQKKNKELKEKNMVLEREDRLKKELIHLIVHDMKNPLFVIQGNLQMMDMNDQFKVPSIRKYITRIDRSSRNLLRMILNLLDISRLEQNTVDLRLINIDVVEMIKDKIEYFRKIGELEWLNLQFETEYPSMKITADAELLERVMENIFAFIIGNTEENQNIVITVSRENKDVKIGFFHEGHPIPDKFKNKIFLKYAQTELKKAGFKLAKGLGLIFCKLALDEMKADILIEKKIENGNQFWIRSREAVDAKV